MIKQAQPTVRAHDLRCETRLFSDVFTLGSMAFE